MGSKKVATNFPGQVMRMKTPTDAFFIAYVGDIPEGIPLEDFGPKGYAKELEAAGSDIKVFSNKEITLQCGTKAFRTEISWLFKAALPITTYLVSAYKEDKCIFVCTHAWKNPEALESIVQSLTFK